MLKQNNKHLKAGVHLNVIFPNVDFWVRLEGDNFSQRIVKIRES